MGIGITLHSIDQKYDKEIANPDLLSQYISFESNQATNQVGAPITYNNP